MPHLLVPGRRCFPRISGLEGLSRVVLVPYAFKHKPVILHLQASLPGQSEVLAASADLAQALKELITIRQTTLELESEREGLLDSVLPFHL